MNNEGPPAIVMDREKIKETFFLTDEALNGLLRRGMPHIALKSIQLFDANEVYLWLRKNFFHGGELAEDPDREG